MDYSDSLDQKQRRILPRQDSEDPSVFQQRTPIASERPPAHVVQAIGQLFVYYFWHQQLYSNRKCSKWEKFLRGTL